MNRDNHEIAEGVFIRLQPDEAKEVWSALAELGYKTGAEGLKEFIFDELFESDEPEQPANPLEELLARNPEAISRAGAALANFTRNAIKQFKRHQEQASR